MSGVEQAHAEAGYVVPLALPLQMLMIAIALTMLVAVLVFGVWGVTDAVRREVQGWRDRRSVARNQWAAREARRDQHRAGGHR